MFLNCLYFSEFDYIFFVCIVLLIWLYFDFYKGEKFGFYVYFKLSVNNFDIFVY